MDDQQPIGTTESQWFVELYSTALTIHLTCHDRDGAVVECKRDTVDRSHYQEQLEEELLFASSDKIDPDPMQPDPFIVDESTVRCWSDYNRVDYHPRSIQMLPDFPDRDLGDWVAGKEMFNKYNNRVGGSLGFSGATSELLF